MSTIPSNPVELATSTTWSGYDYSNVSVESQGVLWGRKAEIIIARRATAVNQGSAVAAIDPYTGLPVGSQTTTEGLLLSGTEKGATASTGDAGFHFNFHVASNDFETPNLLTCRIYNLAQSTMNRIVREFDQISLSAGYEHSNYGIIFTGSIKQFRHGKESTTDSFLEIVAGDNDIGYNFGFINTTLSKDAQKDMGVAIYNACCASLQVQPDPQSLQYIRTVATFTPRGRTLYNMSRVQMRELADSIGARWSVQKGVLVVIPNQGVRAGTYIELNPATGLVGIPHQTDQGVEARIMLNPILDIGTQVGINRDLIVETTVIDHARPNLGYMMEVSQINQYRILSIDHYGDTRGQDWYTDITCIALESTSDSNNRALQSAGGSS